MKLSGQVVVITGGGRGIGRATALALVREGASVVVGAKTVTEIEAVANEIQKQGGDSLAVAVDVTSKSAVQSFFAQAFEKFGHVDILVNNAGVAIHNPISEIREEDWDANLDVNLKGTFLCTQAVFAHMCERKKGHIVNVSSISGKNGHVDGGAYCAAKFGVIGFTQVTQAEGKAFGVKATAICPGPVDTRMRRENHPDDVIEELTTAADVAASILYVVTQPPVAYTPEIVVRTPFMM